MADPRLGRGLRNIFSTSGRVAMGESSAEISRIIPNRLQPRREFDAKGLAELAASIRVHGVLQPLIVRRIGDDRFELVSGERRLRAAKEAGLTQVPIVVRESVSDRDALELALIENVQRSDLDPIEKARGYRQLIEQFGLSQEQVSDRVGQERSTVANQIRLLDLPEEIQTAVSRGTISMGHARAILGLPGKEGMLRLFQRIVMQGLSVRDTEAIVRDGRGLLVAGRPRRKDSRPPWLTELEERLQSGLSARVRIGRGPSGRSEIHIVVSSDPDLERVCEKMLGGGRATPPPGPP